MSLTGGNQYSFARDEDGYSHTDDVAHISYYFPLSAKRELDPEGTRSQSKP